LVILQRANDVAGAFLVFSKEFTDLMKVGNEAEKMLYKLKKSKGSVDNIGYSYVIKKIQMDMLKYKNDSAKYDYFNLLLEGRWPKTTSIKQARAALDELESLAHRWKQWSHLVKIDNHLEMY